MMWRRVVLVLVGIAIIVIVGFGVILVDRSDRAATRTEGTSPTNFERSGPATPPSTVVAAKSPPSGPPGSDGRVEQQALSPGTSPTEGTGRSQTAANEKINESTQAKFGAVTEESVPSRADAFRISQSIQTQCRKDPEPNRESCEKVYALVDEMNQEERDNEWAARTESRVRDVVKGRFETFEVRRVECRTSLCAVEVVATFGTHFELLREKELEFAGIEDDGTYLIGWENDPYQGKLQITLRVFTRRVH